MRSSMGVLAIVCMVLLGQPALAGPAIGVTGGSGGAPGATTAHGWRFTANEDILLTDLGLYDGGDDGMTVEHQIGLFQLDTAALLTSGVIHAGVGDPLIDHFRYVDVPDVALQAGVDYVVCYYTALASSDIVLTTPTGFWTDPAITYVEARYGINSLAIPPTATTTYYRIGPNFLFVPEPSAICLLLAGGLMSIRRRG